MKENIEEDKKIVQEFLIEQNKRKQRLIDNPYRQLFYTDEELQAIDHVISDYKRVLKENEKLKKQNYDLLRKLKNRVKEVRKLEKYSMYKKEFSTLNKKVNELQKENEELKAENNKLKVIKYDTNYGTETINLIPKSELVKINTNRYMIEIENGKFVDLKQVYQENEELKEKWDKDTHKLQNDLDIANAKIIELKQELMEG